MRPIYKGIKGKCYTSKNIKKADEEKIKRKMRKTTTTHTRERNNNNAIILQISITLMMVKASIPALIRTKQQCL